MQKSITGEEQFQHDLATQSLTCMDKPGPGMGSGQGSNGRKDFHVFLCAMSTSDTEVSIRDNSTEVNNAGGNIEEIS